MSVRSRFVAGTMLDEGRRLLRRQGEQIQRVLTSRTGRLLNNRYATISYRGMSTEFPMLSMGWSLYMRFLDMRQLHLGSKIIRPRRRRRIYNHFFESFIGRLSWRLRYDFTDETRRAIISAISGNK